MGIKQLKKSMRRFFIRRRSKKLTVVAVVALSLIGLFAYATYMNHRELSVDPTTYRQLLDLIADAESNGDYNAYFGNAGNAKIAFTDMTIGEVLAWQTAFVADGNASSAVGRYQILNTTLEGLVDQLRLDSEQLFNEKTQDQLAIALLERRGSVAYVNQKMTSQEFAANLAKEWAGLPKMIGDNPQQSYYANDDLNRAQVGPNDVLDAIKPISH